MIEIGNVVSLDKEEYFIFKIKDNYIYLMTTHQPILIKLCEYKDNKLEVVTDKKQIIKLLSDDSNE